MAPPPVLPRTLCLLVAAVALGTGCSAPGPAANASPAAAEAEIAQAREAVSEARAIGAEAVAPAELRAATSRLTQAEQALLAGDTARAERLAREAAVDGRLAEVTVLAERARAARQLYAEVDALRASVDSVLSQ